MKSSSASSRGRAAAEVLRGAAPIREDPNPGALRWCLHGVYDLLWLAAIVVGSPWLLWRMARDGTFRKMLRERLGWRLPQLDPPGGKRRILVHGVSVGEIKSAQALVRELEATLEPRRTEVVMSTSTATGLEIARQTYPEQALVRFPFDLSWIARRFLRRIAPDCIVLVELEIWPNFLRECNRLGIPVAVVNGRITAKSFRSYRAFRHLLPQFNRISLFCAQQADYAERFLALCSDPERVFVTGNLKVDGLEPAAADPPPELRRLLGGAAGQAIVVCGSTHAPEERDLVALWRAAIPETRLILVPRHPQRAAQIAHELGARGCAPQRLTELRSGLIEPDPRRPLLVDTIGELERIYALADVVFVGGSLVAHGGQNMLEPIAKGRPVVYGPHVGNFAQEAALLESVGAARRVADVQELGRTLRELLADAGVRARMSAAGSAALESQRGATRRTVAALERVCLVP